MKRALMIVVLCATATTAMAQEEEEVRFPYGLLVAEQARASFTLLGAGARAAGMGGAFTAVADDATAASFNPAGLAQLLEPEASLVMNGSRLTDTYTDFVSFGQESPPLGFTDTEVEFDKYHLNFVSLTFPFRMAGRRWAVQLSQHRRVDFEYEGAVSFLAADEDGRSVQHVFQESFQGGDISTLSASMAVELTPRTLLGVSFNRWDGDWGFHSANFHASPQDPTAREGFSLSQHTKLSGNNVDIGVLLRYPRVNVGLRYSTSFDSDFFLTNLVIPSDPPALSRLNTTMHWPHTLNAGISFRPTENWTLALDWGRTDWSQLSFEVPAEDNRERVPINFFDLQERQYTLATATDDWRLGTEVLLFSGQTTIPLRFGVFREPQPSRDTYTLEQIVADGVAFGIGVKRGSVAFDIAARYKRSETAVSRYFLAEDLATSDLAPNSFGTLARDELSVYASLIIQFRRGSGLSNLFHRIFVGPVEKDAPVDEVESQH
jgi:hypothetical protein